MLPPKPNHKGPRRKVNPFVQKVPPAHRSAGKPTTRRPSANLAPNNQFTNELAREYEKLKPLPFKPIIEQTEFPFMGEAKDKIDSVFDFFEKGIDGFSNLMDNGSQPDTEQEDNVPPTSQKQLAMTKPATKSKPTKIIDAESKEITTDNSEFAEMAIDYWWASHLDPQTQSYTQHAFRENSHYMKEGDPKGIIRCKAICDEEFNAQNVQGRAKLEPGKRIIACTSCIIGVSVRG